MTANVIAEASGDPPTGAANWTKVDFPAGEAVGQLQWALGAITLSMPRWEAPSPLARTGALRFRMCIRGEPARRRESITLRSGRMHPPIPPGSDLRAWRQHNVCVLRRWRHMGRRPRPIAAELGGAVSSVANSNTPSVMVISPHAITDLCHSKRKRRRAVCDLVSRGLLHLRGRCHGIYLGGPASSRSFARPDTQIAATFSLR